MARAVIRHAPNEREERAGARSQDDYLEYIYIHSTTALKRVYMTSWCAHEGSCGPRHTWVVDVPCSLFHSNESGYCRFLRPRLAMSIIGLTMVPPTLIGSLRLTAQFRADWMRDLNVLRHNLVAGSTKVRCCRVIH